MDLLFFFFFKLNIYLFIYFYFGLHWGFVAAHRLSLVAVCRLLVAVAPVVAEHGSSILQDSVVVAPGLSCPGACELFLD